MNDAAAPIGTNADHPSAPVILGSGAYRYRVVEDWAKLPDGWEFRDVAAVAVDSSDTVYVFNTMIHTVGVGNDDSHVRCLQPAGHDCMMDTGANVGLAADESILTDVHDIPPVTIGVALSGQEETACECTRMGCMPITRSDEEVHM